MNDAPREDGPAGERTTRELMQGVRLDLVIALCALLISSVAAGASWWQARILEAQTRVLQEQLGAQVWPYVSIAENLNNNAVSISIKNDGLGPAILQSASAKVDGKPEHSFIDVMHALIGQHIIERASRHHGESIGLSLASGGSGSVLRPGDETVVFALRSARLAPQFLRASSRLALSTCYCAIIPGKCWISNSTSGSGAQPVSVCREDKGDLMHASVIDAIAKPNY